MELPISLRELPQLLDNLLPQMFLSVIDYDISISPATRKLSNPFSVCRIKRPQASPRLAKRSGEASLA